MKIKNIKVNAYGNIENKDINLEEGINIIHGANESGKSPTSSPRSSQKWEIIHSRSNLVTVPYPRTTSSYKQLPRRLRGPRAEYPRPAGPGHRAGRSTA